MTGRTDVINRALIKLGVNTIATVNEESEPARKAALVFDTLAQSELRKQAWSFALKRLALAADIDTPVSTFGRAYSLPTDFLRLVDYGPYWVFGGAITVNMQDVDPPYAIEGQKILTNDTGALYIRYVCDLSGNTGLWDATFVEAFACRLAAELAPTLTKNRVKARDMLELYASQIREAKRCNAIELPPTNAEDGSWVRTREIG